MAANKRKRFSWTDPTTDKKYKDICTLPKFMRLLEDVIEDEERAESFMSAYGEVCDDAEHNLGYLANLIKDPDIRDDVLDLFLVDLQDEPRRLLNRPYSLSSQVRGG